MRGTRGALSGFHRCAMNRLALLRFAAAALSLAHCCRELPAQEFTFWKVEKIAGGKEEIAGPTKVICMQVPTSSGGSMKLCEGNPLRSDLPVKMELPKGAAITLTSAGRAPVVLHSGDAKVSIDKAINIQDGTIRIENLAGWLRPVPAVYHRYVARDLRTTYEVSIKKSVASREQFCVSVAEGVVEIRLMLRPPDEPLVVAVLVGPDSAEKWPGHKQSDCFPLNDASRLQYFDVYGNAERAYREALEEVKKSASPKRIADAWIDLARFLQELGRYDSAIREYEAALSYDGIPQADRFWMLNNAGIAYLRVGKSDTALAKHEQARKIAAHLGDEKLVSNLINTGNVLLEFERVNEAVARYSQAVKQLDGAWFPSRGLLAKARIALAAAQFSAGRACEAKAQLESAKKGASREGCVSDDFLVDLNLAELYAQQGQFSDAQGALEAAERKQNDDCEAPRAHLASAWGKLLAASGDLEGAEKKYQEAFDLRERLTPDHHAELARLRIALAQVALRQFQLEQSSQHLLQARLLIEQLPAAGFPLLNADFLHAQGLLQTQLGEFALARHDLEDAYRRRKGIFGEGPHWALEESLVALAAAAKNLNDAAAAAAYEHALAAMKQKSNAAVKCS
jgi:tetratricopeptide (TPR) repeat protein